VLLPPINATSRARGMAGVMVSMPVISSRTHPPTDPATSPPTDPATRPATGPAAPAAGGAAAAPVGRAMGVVLCLLTVFGPISMDLYLPVLPALTRDLHTSTSAAQLTVTACLLGLALGQVVAGPISDRFGRRRPLLVGVLAYVVASVLCAVSPTISTLVAARLLQGLAGAVGIVIAQAAGRDLYSGGRLLRYYGRLTVLAGLAAIIGPVLGGQLAKLTDWRGAFVVLALAGVLILVASVGVLRETLPVARRHTGGLADSGRVFRRLLADRVFLGAVLVTGFVNAALFAYLSGATFVLQGIYGLSPQGYSFAFGLNSLGFMTFGFIAGRASERWSVRGTLVVGLVMVVTGASGVLLTGVAHLPLVVMVCSLLTLVSGVAVTTPPTTSLALEGYPDVAGSASSLLGLARFAFGGVTAPLVGLAGAGTAVPLGLVAVGGALLSLVGYALLRRPVVTVAG
jgi:DHA1 family bicyclomycin/chloramphenicol resistance-like MFS transporter